MIRKAQYCDPKQDKERMQNLLSASRNHKMILLTIEPSSLCNLKCKFCTFQANNGKRFLKKYGNMSMSVYTKVVEQIEELPFRFKSINFFLHGESLLNKYLYDMVKIASKKNLAESKYVIATNGTLMTPNTLDKIIESGVNQIIVSLDVITEERYNDFKGSNNPKFGLQPLLANIKYAIHEITKHPEVDLEIKCTYPVSGDDGEAVNYFCDEADRIVDYFRDDVEASQNIHVTMAEEFVWPEHSMNSNNCCNDSCEIPFYQLVVHYDGKVTACCRDYTYDLEIGDLTNGDIIADILDGEKLRAIRRAHLSGNLDAFPYCQTCTGRTKVDFTGHVEELRELIE